MTRTPAPTTPLLPRLRLKTLFACLLLATALPGTGLQGARADGDDHERARRAVESDQVRPLSDILAKVRPSLPGRIIGTEFEEDHGRYIYEFKVISPSGRLREVHVDAATGAILSEEDD